MARTWAGIRKPGDLPAHETKPDGVCRCRVPRRIRLALIAPFKTGHVLWATRRNFWSA